MLGYFLGYFFSGVSVVYLDSFLGGRFVKSKRVNRYLFCWVERSGRWVGFR